jgi:hypothetical protein
MTFRGQGAFPNFGRARPANVCSYHGTKNSLETNARQSGLRTDSSPFTVVNTTSQRRPNSTSLEQLLLLRVLSIDRGSVYYQLVELEGSFKCSVIEDSITE